MAGSHGCHTSHRPPPRFLNLPPHMGITDKRGHSSRQPVRLLHTRRLLQKHTQSGPFNSILPQYRQPDHPQSAVGEHHKKLLDGKPSPRDELLHLERQAKPALKVEDTLKARTKRIYLKYSTYYIELPAALLSGPSQSFTGMLLFSFGIQSIIRA